MNEGLYDIEVLANQCRSDQSREHITEAIRCYKAGAYRATIVTAWIALVFDLLDKIRELSLSGDASAKALESKYAVYVAQINNQNQDGIKGALEFERKILETCRDTLQFFDSQQFVDLERLREDRHRCAHPSFQDVGVPYYPSAEQARLHIRNTVIHVLAMPPVQGKAALAELKTLVASDYFPLDHKSAEIHLRDSSLGNGTDALFKGFVDSLVFGFVTKSDPLYHKAQVYYALNALHQIKPSVVSERLRKNLNSVVVGAPDKDFASAAALIAWVEGALEMLDIPARNKIKRYVEVGPIAPLLSQFEAFYFMPLLTSVVVVRINTLTVSELAVGVTTTLRYAAKHRAIQLLGSARNWDATNEVFDKLILPLFGSLTGEDVKRIIRMPQETGADLIGAHSYTLFIENVRKHSVVASEELNDMLDANQASYLVKS
ncbi:hypothetical protein [Pseudomonas coronafaciens]|uniref:hypothetical protein n=1 Tax=Pseudomonas coronafaciens TaxID=53409 RepID=UPI000F00E1B7|nr:hypothetical protein [Pseudomonas coronafaciens]RMS92483.1 hypothetical protein ALP57_01063 [Pseudomonas coronafaciens pv. oryzae]RMS94435.1 hypothetical protein ALP56_02711 [Pseudomonas coronafaciens pv. oryzae]